MRSIIITLLILVVAMNGFAQKDASVAFSGYKGNYIYNLFKPASPEHPDGDVVGFRLDRKAVTERNWQTLQKFNTPQSYAELSNNVSRAIPKVYEYNPATAYSVESIWPIFKKNFSYDSLSVYLTQQHMAAAFNILLIDSGINRNVAYQYRVIQIKRDNTEGLKYTTVAVNGSEVVNAAKPRIKSRLTRGGNFNITFKAKATQPITEALLVRRREGMKSEFKRIETFYTIEQTADSVYYTVVDENVNSEQVYQYTITPVTRFGGGGRVISDTVSATLINKDLLLPLQFTATADSVADQINLNWKFLRPELISVVNVFRSAEYEDGYENIGSSSDGSFIDRRSVTGKKYYYYLVINDKLGQNSLRSAKIYSLLHTAKKPSVPIYVEVQKTNSGNVVSWQDFEQSTRGWYIYKTNQLEGKLVLSSEFIFKEEKKKDYSFTDTTKNGEITGYAVVSESLSNVRGDFSPTVYVKQKGGMKPVIAPTIVDATKAGDKYHVFWRDDATTVDLITGYNVYRKVDDKGFVKINKVALENSKSSYTDSVESKGFKIIYKIAALDQSGKESTSEEYVAAYESQIYPPSSLKAFLTGDKKLIRINWQPSQSQVSKYEIYRFTRGKEPVKIAEKNGENVSFSDATFERDATNYYYVIAKGLNGSTSVRSNQAFAGVVN
ncbi:hypothetical protein [Pedobacter frigoris]|uniref:hypothetical protein n=1 Tax=Pedobacter frigoris TaxID=2571272 RepID=UPI0029300127|nr:hypothetical protein [Pedobacter frigoris]